MTIIRLNFGCKIGLETKWFDISLIGLCKSTATTHIGYEASLVVQTLF